MNLVHRKCEHPLVYDHIENKWFCFKCREYPKLDEIVFNAKESSEE